jgi:hypothetical protein
MTTRRSSATSVEFDAAEVMMASLNNLSSFDNAIEVSHRAFSITFETGAASEPCRVEMRSKSAEFEDRVLLQFFGRRHRVVMVVLINQYAVVRLVYDFDVQLKRPRKFAYFNPKDATYVAQQPNMA